MKLLILLLAFTSLVYSSLILSNPEGCAYPYTITQTARGSWTQDSSVFTVYDIIITNIGDTSFEPYFFIGIYSDISVELQQTWNLVLYAWTDPRHLVISVVPSLGISIAPGNNWTGTGYITNTSTEIVLFSDSCPVNPITPPANSTTNTCAEVTFNLRTSWVTNSVSYYLYDLTISNSGTRPLTVVSFTLISLADFQISQEWNLVDFGSTNPTQHPVGLRQDEGISISEGGVYTGAGLIISGSPLSSIDVWQSNCS